MHLHDCRNLALYLVRVGLTWRVVILILVLNEVNLVESRRDRHAWHNLWLVSLMLIESESVWQHCRFLLTLCTRFNYRLNNLRCFLSYRLLFLVHHWGISLRLWFNLLWWLLFHRLYFGDSLHSTERAYPYLWLWSLRGVFCVLVSHQHIHQQLFIMNSDLDLLIVGALSSWYMHWSCMSFFFAFFLLNYYSVELFLLCKICNILFIFTPL
jgi:hypothetical protein